MQRYAIVLLILILAIVLSTTGMIYIANERVAEKTTLTNTVTTSTTKIQTELQLFTTTLPSTSTITETSFRNVTTTSSATETLPSGNSIDKILVANISGISNPEGITINQKTNTIYVENWGNIFANYVDNNTISVINGTTDRLQTTITGVAVSYPYPPPPLVNSLTNMIYSGNEIINGSTDRISGYINQSLNFDALDSVDGILFAKNISTTFPNNEPPIWNTTLYELNATNDEIIRSRIFPGILSEEMFDPVNDLLYTEDCVPLGVACQPNNLVSISSANMNVVGNVSVFTSGLYWQMALNQVSNSIYVVSAQNFLTIVNATRDQITDEYPLTAWTMTFGGIAVNPYPNSSAGIEIPSGDIFVSGNAFCANQFSGCNESSLYVFSTENYGLFGTYVSPVALGSLEFDSVNNQTYVLTDSSLLALKIPSFRVTVLLP